MYTHAWTHAEMRSNTHTCKRTHTLSHTLLLVCVFVCMCIYATHCNTLQYTATHCNTLLACKCRDWKAEGLTTFVDLSTLENERVCKNVSSTPVIHCNALQHVFCGLPRWYVRHGLFILCATHRTDWQRTIPHCTTLQHTTPCTHMKDEPVMS